MKVLLIGGTGCISSEITALAATKPQIELYVLNRGNRPQFVPANVKTIPGDINDVSGIREKIRELQFDVLVDFLAYGTEHVRRDLDLFRGHFRQYVFISSTAVYRTLQPNAVIREDSTMAGNINWKYGREKMLAERLLAELRETEGLDYTIVRPNFTYNNLRIFTAVCSDAHQHVSWTLADRILKGKPLLMFDDGNALCTMIYAADFAKGFVGLLGNGDAYGEAYHITCDEHFTFNRAAEMIGETLGVETKLCHVPAHLLGLELGDHFGEKFVSFGRNGGIFDSSKIRKLVPEFKCETYFAAGLRKCIDFYEAHPEYKVVDPQWDADMDRIAAKYGDCFP